MVYRLGRLPKQVTWSPPDPPAGNPPINSHTCVQRPSNTHHRVSLSNTVKYHQGHLQKDSKDKNKIKDFEGNRQARIRRKLKKNKIYRNLRPNITSMKQEQKVIKRER